MSENSLTIRRCPAPRGRTDICRIAQTHRRRRPRTARCTDWQWIGSQIPYPLHRSRSGNLHATYSFRVATKNGAAHDMNASFPADLRIAVITPCYNTPMAWLEQCRQSVLAQTLPCTHILVNDGGDPPRVDKSGTTQIISLPRPHQDVGNAGRAIGSVTAICQGFDALAYLDADNWYEPTHLESLAVLHRATGAAVCSSTRNLYGPDGRLLGRCPEVEGEQFVDTNCLFLTSAAFAAVSVWYMAPRSQRSWPTKRSGGPSRICNCNAPTPVCQPLPTAPTIACTSTTSVLLPLQARR